MSDLSNPPAAILKDVKPFLARANELAAVNPIVSYFCKIYIAELIIKKGYHAESKEVRIYLAKVLDDIETTKANAPDDVREVFDDKKLQINYVQSFTYDVFDSLNRQVETQTVTKSTALGFIASVNFLQLLQLWEPFQEGGELHADLVQRIKYAKFHAARILKSLKNGEDPNEYEVPKPKEDPEVEDQIKQLERQLKAEGVEEGEEEKGSSVVPGDDPANPADEEDEKDEKDEKDSIANNTTHYNTGSSLPNFPEIKEQKDDQSDTAHSKEENDEPNFPKIPLEPSKSPPARITKMPSPAPAPEPASKPAVAPKPAVQKRPSLNKEQISSIFEETEVISKAQRHAKYAISALDYEDKATAIEELKKALALLSL